MRTLLVLALTLAPAPAVAQQPPAPAGQPRPVAQPPAQGAASTCDVQIDSSRHSRFLLQNGYYQTFAWSGVWAHCRGQPTTMYSDSVAWYPDRDLLYLVGNVRFRDSVTVLNADQVTYYLHQERLYAEGHVYTRNLRSGSDLRGNNLDYYRAAPPVRDTLELFARQRPTIRFYPSNRTEKADTEPFVVVADRTHMKGNDEMWGGGNVTIDRSDLSARGDSAWLDLGHDAASLLGSPVVNGVGPDAYHLRGDRLTFGLTPQHEIRRVLASGHAAATGADWRLDADTLDLTLDSSKVQRAQAWGKELRPHAVSGTHTVVADSLDIHMPGQLVRLVWAWRNARMVTRDTTVRPAARDSAAPRAAAPRDSAAVAAARAAALRAKAGRLQASGDTAAARTITADAGARPGAAPRDSLRSGGAMGDSLRPGGTARDSVAGRARGVAAARRPSTSDSMARGALTGGEDWLLGDSLRADFLVLHDSAGGKPKSELRHLTSYGSARALYHVEESDTARGDGCRSINYSRGDRIDIASNGSKVQTVDVVGQSDGMYLECNPPAPADTTHRADATGVGGAGAGAAADSARARADSLRAGPAADTTGRAAADTLPKPAAPDTTRRPAPPATPLQRPRRPMR